MENLEHEPSEHRAVELVSQVGLAALLRVSKQRVGQLIDAGKTPEPFGMIEGRRPVWTLDQALDFAAFRTDQPVETIEIPWLPE